jgi:hypothetical protein
VWRSAAVDHPVRPPPSIRSISCNGKKHAPREAPRNEQAGTKTEHSEQHDRPAQRAAQPLRFGVRALRRDGFTRPRASSAPTACCTASGSPRKAAASTAGSSSSRTAPRVRCGFAQRPLAAKKRRRAAAASGKRAAATDADMSPHPCSPRFPRARRRGRRHALEQVDRDEPRQHQDGSQRADAQAQAVDRISEPAEQPGQGALAAHSPSTSPASASSREMRRPRANVRPARLTNAPQATATSRWMIRDSEANSATRTGPPATKSALEAGADATRGRAFVSAWTSSSSCGIARDTAPACLGSPPDARPVRVRRSAAPRSRALEPLRPAPGWQRPGLGAAKSTERAVRRLRRYPGFRGRATCLVR